MNYKKLSKVNDALEDAIYNFTIHANDNDPSFGIPADIVSVLENKRSDIEAILKKYKISAEAESIYHDDPTLYAQDYQITSFDDLGEPDTEGTGYLEINLITGEVEADGTTHKGVSMKDIANELLQVLKPELKFNYESQES